MRLAPFAARLAAIALVAGAASVSSLSGCAATGGGAQGTASGDELVGADDSGDARAAESVLGSVPVGSQLKATTGVNLRAGASTSYKIYHVVPAGALVTVVSSVPQNGFYQVKHLGVTGWSFGAYYNKVASGDSSGGGGGTPVPSTSRDNAIARAKEGVGFSYWWGHGRWQASGPTSSNKGSCSGSCPSCSHGGSYGADCSGYVGKIWAVGQSADVSVDAHPYSTGSFINDTSQWHTVSRGSVQKGDALVHNESGSGHIFLYESGDGWGSMWAYEAKGCSYGIVHNIRTATSNYHAISHY
jgi:uncharacterized protein YgiM (DUF1202 family)